MKTEKAEVELTKREIEIAEWISAGMIKKEISQLLGITVRTVENITRNIYVKTEVKSIGQLASWFYHKKYNIPLKKLPTLDEIHQLRHRKKTIWNKN